MRDGRKAEFWLRWTACRRAHHHVIGRVKALPELARGQPDLVGALRRYLLPGMKKFPPTAHAMLDLLTGLDHEVTTQ